jgi:hypothetical protein
MKPSETALRLRVSLLKLLSASLLQRIIRNVSPVSGLLLGRVSDMLGIKIPWQVFACAGLVAFLSLFGWYWDHHGASRVQARWDASIERGKVIVKDLKAGQNKLTVRVETKYIDRWRTIHEKGDTITKLVPQYIPSGTCDLPAGFRVLHDNAVSSTIPQPSELTNAAPVSVAEATSTVTENYTTCNAAISDLAGLREWLEGQQQAYRELCKQRGVVCSKDN